MAILAGVAIWAMMLATTTAEPPVPPVPDIASAAIVTVLDAQGGEALVVQRSDKSYLTVRLACVMVDSQDVERRHFAWAFLHNLLAGERVWLIKTDLAAAGEETCYVYRWPDKLLVNLEMVRQGYGDVSSDAFMPAGVKQAFTYWRDQARLHHKGVWSLPAMAAATAPTIAPPAGTTAMAPAVPSQAAAKQAVVSKEAVRASSAAGDEMIVYVSPSGKKYHRAECKSLRGTKTPMTLEEARKSREPCKQCKPLD